MLYLCTFKAMCPMQINLFIFFEFSELTCHVFCFFLPVIYVKGLKQSNSFCPGTGLDWSSIPANFFIYWSRITLVLPITTHWQEILPQSTQTQVCLFIDTVGMVHCQHLKQHDTKADDIYAGYTYKSSTNHIVMIIIIVAVICNEAVYFQECRFLPSYFLAPSLFLFFLSLSS